MMRMEKETVLGRMVGGVALPGDEVPDEIMWMPAGVHTITAQKGGRPYRVTVRVDRDTAAVLERALREYLASSAHRPYFDLNHRDDEASGWPVGFRWVEGPRAGVYARVEWSAAGREAIAGKLYRTFSPSFYADRGNPARITGAPRNMGGLVNDPAFAEMAPIWARRGGDFAGQSAAGSGSKGSNTGDKTMSDEEKAALKARLEELRAAVTELQGREQTAEVAEALQAKRAELTAAEAEWAAEELRAKNQALEQALLAQRRKDAEEAVRTAVARGAIPAKDEALQAKWREWCTEDPDKIGALKAMRGAAALELPRLTLSNVKITREDSQAVLKAYAAEKDPMKRGILYAREIRPRLDEGDDLPIHAHTLGTVSGTLVTQRTLELLRLRFPLLRRISTDFSPEGARYNQTISTRIVGIPAVVSYESGGAGTGWTSQDVTDVDVNIKLSAHRGVPITFNTQTLGSTVRRLFDEHAPAASYALGKDLVDALYAKITAANFTNDPTVAAQIDFGRSTVIDLGTALDERGVPDGADNRTLLLCAAYYGQLAKDNAIVTLAAMSRPEILTAGVLPDVEGFYVIKAVNLPSTGNLKGFGFSKSALTLVTRTDGDYLNVFPNAGGTSQIVTDAETGLSVLQVQYVDHKLAAATQRISLMYGVGGGKLGGASGSEPGGQENAGQLLLSAAA